MPHKFPRGRRLNDPQAGAPLESTKVPLHAYARVRMPNYGHKEDLWSDILVREGGHVYSLARATRRVPGRQGNGLHLLPWRQLWVLPQDCGTGVPTQRSSSSHPKQPSAALHLTVAHTIPF